MEIVEIIHKNLELKLDSEAVKVFLFPHDPNSRKSKKPEADGLVRFNKQDLSANRQVFENYVAKNGFSQGSEHSWLDFTTNNGEDMPTKDDVLLLMAALEVLGFGEVTANTINEEKILNNGFIEFPKFKFKG